MQVPEEIVNKEFRKDIFKREIFILDLFINKDVGRS